MNKRMLLLALPLWCLFSSCGKDDSGIPDWPWKDTPEEEKTEANPDIVSQGWSNVTENYGSLPEYINIYKSPDQLTSKSAIAYIAVADIEKGASWEVLGDLGYCSDANVANYGAESVNTPQQFYLSSKAPVVINGGLFFYAAKSDGSDFYVSQNLAVRNSEVLAINQTYWVEDWSSDPLVMWYPTIGAFVQKADKTCATTWTYTTSAATYTYDTPADNSTSKDPLEVPSATFPTTAGKLEAVNAIGGVGVLVKDGKIVNSWEQEMMDVSADSDQPRTAIGYTADKKMIFFVCEGRNMTEGVAGLTTGNVAEVMKALGCTEALNLDGGGSSCMLVNGQETIKPSDGSQRAVLTGVKLY